MLSDLVAATNLQAELFAIVPDADLAARGKSEKIVPRYGQDQSPLWARQHPYWHDTVAGPVFIRQ